jgi:hypothetical protein
MEEIQPKLVKNSDQNGKNALKRVITEVCSAKGMTRDQAEKVFKSYEKGKDLLRFMYIHKFQSSCKAISQDSEVEVDFKKKLHCHEYNRKYNDPLVKKRFTTDFHAFCADRLRTQALQHCAISVQLGASGDDLLTV